MPCKKIEMADPAQKPKRVGQQLEPNVLGSSIYETKRCWVPVSTNILGSSIYATSTGYQQRYSQKSKRVRESNHSQESKRVYWVPVFTKPKDTGFQYLRIYWVPVSTNILGSSIYEYTGFQYIRNLNRIQAAVFAKIKTGWRIHSLVKIHRKTWKMWPRHFQMKKFYWF